MHSKSTPFNPQKDIPPLTGKTILVTGGNIGLGKQAILELARHNPSEIWLAARSPEKAAAAVTEIQSQLTSTSSSSSSSPPDDDNNASSSKPTSSSPVIKILELDLASLDSVHRAASRVRSESTRLDILMLNAGIMATPPGLTKEGYEIQFGTNHMGHALLTKLLLPLLESTASEKNGDGSPRDDVRVVSLSSDAHTMAPKERGGILYETLKTEAEDLGAWGRYGQSKLANILFARRLAHLHPNLKVVAVHPGIVATNLMNGATGSPAIVRVFQPLLKYFVKSPADGAKNQLWASVATKGITSGEYYEPVGVAGKGRPEGRDDELAAKLWDWTEKELEKYVIE